MLPTSPFIYSSCISAFSSISTHIGVVVLTNCRPRVAGASRVKNWDHFNLPVTLYRATQRLDVEGIYILLPESQLKPDGWINWLQQIKVTNVPNIELADVIKLMDAVMMFGEQCKDVRSKARIYTLQSHRLMICSDYSRESRSPS